MCARCVSTVWVSSAARRRERSPCYRALGDMPSHVLLSRRQGPRDCEPGRGDGAQRDFVELGSTVRAALVIPEKAPSKSWDLAPQRIRTNREVFGQQKQAPCAQCLIGSSNYAAPHAGAMAITRIARLVGLIALNPSSFFAFFLRTLAGSSRTDDVSCGDSIPACDRSQAPTHTSEGDLTMIRKSATTAFKSTQTQRRTRWSLRARVAAAFREIARGVDERTAHDRTHDFYRSSGADWARCLS